MATPASRAFVPGEGEHLVGHVQAVGGAGRPDALGGQDHVDAAAGAQVEHRLTLAQLRDRGRVAAAERCQHGGVGQLVALLGVIQRLAEIRRVILPVGAAAAAPTATALGALPSPRAPTRHIAPHLFAQLIG